MESRPHGRDEKLADILDRAQRIDDETALLLERDPAALELVSAAEEAGLSRDAVIQALRERLRHIAPRFKPGEYVFAKSYEGYGYAAAVVDEFGDDTHVRFLNGGEGTVATSDLRPLGLMPGQSVEFMSKSMGWGMWLEGKVVRFNSETKSVTLDYWGMSEEILPLELVRLPKEKKPFQLGEVVKGKFMLVALAIASGIATALALYFLMRR